MNYVITRIVLNHVLDYEVKVEPTFNYRPVTKTVDRPVTKTVGRPVTKSVYRAVNDVVRGIVGEWPISWDLGVTMGEEKNLPPHWEGWGPIHRKKLGNSGYWTITRRSNMDVYQDVQEDVQKQIFRVVMLRTYDSVYNTVGNLLGHAVYVAADKALHNTANENIPHHWGTWGSEGA